jgi:mycothiol system anti-sigma-R factor
MGDSHDQCEESLHLVYHYLDGELTDEKRSLIQQHIDDCPPCFEAFDFEHELRLVIKRRCHDEAPDDLRRRIAEALHHEDHGGPADPEYGLGPNSLL